MVIKTLRSQLFLFLIDVVKKLAYSIFTIIRLHIHNKDTHVTISHVLLIFGIFTEELEDLLRNLQASEQVMYQIWSAIVAAKTRTEALISLQ